MKAWILLCSCLCLLWNGAIARAEGGGQDPYFKVMLKSDEGKMILLFGTLLPAQIEKFYADAEKNSNAKDSDIELYEAYRLVSKPVARGKPTMIFEKIGQGFALSKFDVAILLDKAHANLVIPSTDVPDTETQERGNEKKLVLFYKKGMVPESRSMENLIRASEFSFWLERASSMSY